MKRHFLWCITILGINTAVLALLILAVLFVFRGEWIPVVLPVVVVLPAMLLQPWCFLFSSISGIFPPMGRIVFLLVATTIATAYLYEAMYRKGILDWVIARLSSFKRRFLCFGLLAVVLEVGIAYARHIDYPALHAGIPEVVSSGFKQKDFGVEQSRYYCLWGFINSEWLWQATLPEEGLNRLAAELEMQFVAGGSVPEVFFDQPPYWWSPSRSRNVRIFSTPDFPFSGPGRDGFHVFAVWGPEDRVMHLWIKNNF